MSDQVKGEIRKMSTGRLMEELLKSAAKRTEKADEDRGEGEVARPPSSKHAKVNLPSRG
jgi:hypothetical protein